MPPTEVLCVGEVLWDALPEGLFLGGAPFNVACHLRAAGTAVSMVSRIGNDRLGDEVARRAARYGVGSDLLQVDDALPTGFARVDVDESGNPTYEILVPAAQGMTGRLRVGFVEAATHSEILPDVLSFFRMHLPSVELSLFELP